MGGVGVGWTVLGAETASHPAADVGLGIGDEFVSEWQLCCCALPPLC